MLVPIWIWLTFIFFFGCCIGSFLNVVIYRLPKDKSLVTPPSSCPSCDERIRFYDNIPIVSWVVLGGKCRYCKERISPRYFFIELLTALLFTGLFYLYFYTDIRSGIEMITKGGWIIYLIHIILLGGFIAASAIDLELWVIPLSICWFVTAVGLIGSSVSVFIVDPKIIDGFDLLPTASFRSSLLAIGAAIGLAISLLLLKSGLIKRSYEQDVDGSSDSEVHYNHRVEMCKEIVFLLPIIICSVAFFVIFRTIKPLNSWWLDFLSSTPSMGNFFGSLWGYFIGCGLIWATRIFGTLGFGKEAMGLGDMHLMGAAGTIIGPVFTTIAFFIAPFFGLGWALFQMFFKKTRQIPYGPFLSLGVFVVMIFHDRIFSCLMSLLYQ